MRSRPVSPIVGLPAGFPVPSPLSDSLHALRRLSSKDMVDAITADDAELIVSDRVLGRGGEGTVFEGLLRARSTGAISKVAVKVLNQSFPPRSSPPESSPPQSSPLSPPRSTGGGTLSPEAVVQYQLTGSFASSIAGGILKGLPISHGDGSVVMPRCSFMLSEMMPYILSLGKAENGEWCYVTILIDYLESMLNALNTLSTNHMLHRDIKPQNIGFRERGEMLRDKPVLIDCGGMITESDLRRKECKLVCTPYYAAPEQMVMGVNPERLSASLIDMFSVGIALRELLGQPVQYHPANMEGIVDDLQLCYLKQVQFNEAQKGQPVEKIEAKTPLYETEIAAWASAVPEDVPNTVIACMKKLAEWMTEILPEHRLTLPLFQKALQKIKTIFEADFTEDDFTNLEKWISEGYAQYLLQSKMFTALDKKTLCTDEEFVVAEAAAASVAPATNDQHSPLLENDGYSPIVDVNMADQCGDPNRFRFFPKAEQTHTAGAAVAASPVYSVPPPFELKR